MHFIVDVKPKGKDKFFPHKGSHVLSNPFLKREIRQKTSIYLTLLNCSIAVPSQPPNRFSLTAKTSTIIAASWELPPSESRNGIIKGFKLYYKKKGSSGPTTMEVANGESTRTKDVAGLAKYTEYEFQVLAFTSVGDGPNSSVKVERTKEDGMK